MRFRLKYFLTPALALFLAGPAFAQRSQPPTASQVTPQQSFPAPLYRTPEVARTLDLTSEQQKRLDAAAERLQARYRTEYNRLNSLSATERADRYARLQRDYNAELMRATADILNERQMSRYRQLDLQSRGLGAFGDPDVQRRLNLTAEQQRRLRTLADETGRRARELRPGSADTRRDSLGEWADVQRRALGTADTILTPEQRRLWRELTGERFNFPLTGPGGTSGRTNR